MLKSELKFSSKKKELLKIQYKSPHVHKPAESSKQASFHHNGKKWMLIEEKFFRFSWRCVCASHKAISSNILWWIQNSDGNCFSSSRRQQQWRSSRNDKRTRRKTRTVFRKKLLDNYLNNRFSALQHPESVRGTSCLWLSSFDIGYRSICYARSRKFNDAWWCRNFVLEI